MKYIPLCFLALLFLMPLEQTGVTHLKERRYTQYDWIEVGSRKPVGLKVADFEQNFEGGTESLTLKSMAGAGLGDLVNVQSYVLQEDFLGPDRYACNGDDDIVLNALNSPAGPDVISIIWSVDIDDDGEIDRVLNPGQDPFTLTVRSPDSGRYFVRLISGSGQTYTDDILITFYGVPGPVRVDILNDLSNNNSVEIVVLSNGNYEYALNGGSFQDSPIFKEVPAGQNTVVVRDKICSFATNPIPFLIVGYPKFFTPNGDGINDIWNIQGIRTLNDPTVFIFDRYGKLLKQWDESSEGWDGTFNGRPMPASDYWFRLEYFGGQGNNEPVPNILKSHFALKR